MLHHYLKKEPPLSGAHWGAARSGNGKDFLLQLNDGEDEVRVIITKKETKEIVKFLLKLLNTPPKRKL